MELPWDVLTEVARHLRGRARPVCRAFTEDQRRVLDALRALPRDGWGEATVGKLWDVRVWWDTDDTVSLGCEEVPYAALRSALRRMDPSTVVIDSLDTMEPAHLCDWPEPSHEPAVSVSSVPLRAAAALLSNIGTVHRVSSLVCRSTSTRSLPAPTAGATEVLEVPVIARNRLRKLGIPVPPALTRLPSGAWFRGTHQVARPDLEELLRPLEHLPGRWRHLRHIVVRAGTVLPDASSLRSIAHYRTSTAAATAVPEERAKTPSQ